MNNNCKISVIVPVYNVEKHLRECLNSLINQTIKNLEIICINDESTDNSLEILKEYATLDNRIKIICQKNRGLSAARNKGLKNSTGEYIYFINSDDFISEDYIEKMLNAIIRNNVNIVINNNIIEYKEPLNTKPLSFSYHNPGLHKTGNSVFIFQSMSWCKFYKKSFIDGLNAFFPEDLKYGDYYFDAVTLPYTDVFVIDNGSYFYRQKPDPIIENNQKGAFTLDAIKISKKIFNYYNKYALLNSHKIDFGILYYLLENNQNPYLFYSKLKKYFLYIKKYIIKNRKLYSNDEINFLENIIKHKNYHDYENKKYINFVIAGSRDYITQIGVVITSILLNLKTDAIARFFLFSENFSTQDINMISKVKHIKKCEVINIPIENYIDRFKNIKIEKCKLQYVSLATYFRLLMLEILPDDVDKCFYLDGDLIVNYDLSDIYENFNMNNILSCVVEVLAMQKRKEILSHCYKISDFDKFKKDPYNAPYFNAGFYLLNVKMSKELNLLDKAFDFLERNPNPPYADQDTLNAIIGQTFNDKIEHLTPDYNVFCDMNFNDTFNDAFYSEKDIKQAFSKPKVYHFGGPNKPWRNRNILNNYEIWWQCYKKSPFKNLKQPKITIDTSPLEKIFSLKNNNKYKFVTILGFCIPIKKERFKKYAK